MRIVHAVSNEFGEGRGGAPGDQTGKEIREAKWYDKPWKQVIIPKDRALASSGVVIAKAIAEGNYGYDRDRRWTGYEAICASTIEDGIGDFDCSSLVLSCYKLAGLNIQEKKGSTRDIAKILCDTGKFELVEEGEMLTDPELVRKGTLYCVPGSHVVMCIEDGERSEEEPSTTERVRAKGSVRIRETPKTGKTIAIAHKGDIIEVYGQDEETGWYKCVTGYITNNERYVEKL